MKLAEAAFRLAARPPCGAWTPEHPSQPAHFAPVPHPMPPRLATLTCTHLPTLASGAQGLRKRYGAVEAL